MDACPSTPRDACARPSQARTLPERALTPTRVGMPARARAACPEADPRGGDQNGRGPHDQVLGASVWPPGRQHSRLKTIGADFRGGRSSDAACGDGRQQVRAASRF